MIENLKAFFYSQKKSQRKCHYGGCKKWQEKMKPIYLISGFEYIQRIGNFKTCGLNIKIRNFTFDISPMVSKIPIANLNYRVYN